MTGEEKDRKNRGQYFTPDEVVASLVRWAIRTKKDRLLDPSCGDGRFLAAHRRSVGVEQDPKAHAMAMENAPWALIHEGDFFSWAAETKERFECSAGNPPFIRYQLFTGDIRAKALDLCKSLGAEFPSLTSSWAPFLVATASLLKRGGRMAFVVPAEIGHAPYAESLLTYLANNFSHVQVIAIQEKIFPTLSEDAWLLYADGFGNHTDHFSFSTIKNMKFMEMPPARTMQVNVSEWRAWNCRLRPFLLPRTLRTLYSDWASSPNAIRIGDVARVGIGYVTGANEFFHLKPSVAKRLGISKSLLHPTVRNGRSLTGMSITKAMVKGWLQRDEPVLLLRLSSSGKLDSAVKRYLESPEGIQARESYKCRNRQPWYVVPDVIVPDAFLSYMSGNNPHLVANNAQCACTNSVHAIRLTGHMNIASLQAAWKNDFTELSCEIEGHPLGGGMLKVEPREAARIILASKYRLSRDAQTLITEGLETMKRWRHYV